MKVRPFPGASADDMHHYLQALLEKCPDTVILLVGTNNCVNESSRVVLDKAFDRKASLTVRNLSNHFNSLKLDIVDNSTIGKECLDKKGFHLNKRGTGKVAINFINKIRSL